MEIKNQRKISVLDILIEKSDDKLITTVFRKKTFTGLGLIFFSFSSLIYKKNSIKKEIGLFHQVV